MATLVSNSDNFNIFSIGNFYMYIQVNVNNTAAVLNYLCQQCKLSKLKGEIMERKTVKAYSDQGAFKHNTF